MLGPPAQLYEDNEALPLAKITRSMLDGGGGV